MKFFSVAGTRGTVDGRYDHNGGYQAPARRGFTAFPETVKWPGFLLLSLGILLTSAVLFFAAVWLQTRSAMHKRLMVLASLSIWVPAISRLPLHFIEAGSLWTSIAVGDACVLPYYLLGVLALAVHGASGLGSVLVGHHRPLLAQRAFIAVIVAGGLAAFTIVTTMVIG